MELYISPAMIILENKEGDAILFDSDSLSVAKVNDRCMQLLNFFKNGALVNEAIVKYGSSARESIDKLVNMKFLIGKDKVNQIIKPGVKIRGFRLVLTEKCNLRCKYCYVSKRNKEMSEETLSEAIDKSVKFAGEDGFIYHFFGGEPLLRFDLIRLAVERIEQYRKDGKIGNPLYRITTNGTLITDEIAKFFAEHSFGVGISLDGTKDWNDKIRVYADGRGTYDEAIRGFDILKKNGVEQVWFLITAYNELLDDLPEIVRFMCTTFDISNLTINTPFDSSHIGWTVDGKKFADTLLKCIKIGKESNVKIHSGAMQLLFALGKKIPRTHACMFGENQVRVTVSTDGKISLCTQYWGNKLPREFIFRKSDIIKLPATQQRLCQKCIARNVCGGPCPIHASLSGKIYDKNKCTFYKELLRQTLTGA